LSKGFEGRAAEIASNPCCFSKVICDRDMHLASSLGDEFDAAVRSAGAKARLETLRAWVAVFYRDAQRNIDIMEQPSGRKFEIRFIKGAPRDRNYEVVRELKDTAA
jgi:hypothetical protein